MAPELFSQGTRASKQADIYAFGIVVYEVITGTYPFDAATSLQGSRPPRPEDPVGVGFGQGTWEFVERCWDEDPGQRPTAREALEHFEYISRNSRKVDPGPMMPVSESVRCRSEGSSENSVSVTPLPGA